MKGHILPVHFKKKTHTYRIDFKNYKQNLILNYFCDSRIEFQPFMDQFLKYFSRYANATIE